MPSTKRNMLRLNIRCMTVRLSFCTVNFRNTSLVFIGLHFWKFEVYCYTVRGLNWSEVEFQVEILGSS